MFVLFDRDAKKITNTTVEEITELDEKEEGINQRNQKVPKCLLDIVGKTMDFQVKISEYNSTDSFQTFTVTQITKANSILQAKDDAITTKDKTSTQTEAEMYGNIKKEDGEVRPTFQILGSETASEENETEDAEKQALDDITTEKEAKKRRII
ncbi:hypothetical protein Bca4012_083240 [Brassica carinata]